MLKKLTLLILLVGYTLLSIAQLGSDCGTAIFINTDDCSPIAAFDNSSHTGTIAGSCNTAGNNNSMWFSFIANANIISFEINGTTLTNPVATIFDSNNLNCDNPSSFTEVLCESAFGNQLAFSAENLTKNNIYYLLIDGVGNNTGSFQVCTKSKPAPVNDLICDAITIPSKNFCSPYGAFTTNGATQDLTNGSNSFPPPCAINNELKGVWFKFIAETNYIDISLVGDAQGLKEPMFALYEIPADDCSNTNFASYVIKSCSRNSDNNYSTGATENTLTIGRTYFLWVGSSDGGTGFFNICLSNFIPSGVVNDFCIDALPLCPNQSIAGTTVGASNTNDIPDFLWPCNIETNDMVYYTFSTGAVVNDIVLDIAYSCTGAKLQVAVFEPTSTPCSGSNDGWTNITCVEEGFYPNFEIIIPSANLNPNTTYYLVIDDYPNYQCSFELTITGNSGPNAGNNQQICSTQNAFNPFGFSPNGGTWFGPGIINSSTGRFSPSDAGLGNHTVYYQTGDCIDSKVISVSGPEIAIINNQEICNGDSVQLFAQAIARPKQIIKSFSNNETENLPDLTSGLTKSISVSGISESTFNNETSLANVCINIIHQRARDLEVYLKAPDGSQVRLTRANGSTGFQYTNTCFSDEAYLAIDDGSVTSFNGTFKPEESFSGLNGSNINGTWEIVINDNLGGNSGIFYEWSISFFDYNSFQNNFPQWSPNNNIDNRYSSNPIVYPNSDQTYQFTAIDKNNCGSSKSVDINVLTTEIVSINSNENEICEGDSTAISINAPVGKQYNITLSDGTNNKQIANAENGDIIYVNPSVTSDYTLTAANLVGVGPNCVRPDDKIIRINVRPKPSVVYDSIVHACFGDNVSLSFNFFPPVPLSFSIDTGNANISVNGFNSNPYQLSLVADTTKQILITEIAYDNAPFCSATPLEGPVIKVPQTPNFQITGDTLICAGTNAQLNFITNQTDSLNLNLKINGNDTTIFNIVNSRLFSFAPNSSTLINIVSLYSPKADCTYPIDSTWNISVTPQLTTTILKDTCYTDRSGALIKFLISGGKQPYLVDGVASDSIFEQFIPHGSSYNFVVSDNSPCSDVSVAGNVDCSCNSFAGTLNNQTEIICENDTVFRTIPNDRILEPNDTALFILFRGSSATSIDTIFAVKNVIEFTFDPTTMLQNVKYYIASVVGNKTSSYPWFDKSDSCLSVASFPVFFTEKPRVTITGPDTICLGDDAPINFEIDGSSPFIVSYRYNNDTTTVYNVTDDYDFSFVPDTSGIFKITEIISQSPTCIVHPDTILNINVIERPLAENVTINCIGTDRYYVSFDVVGAEKNSYSVTGNSGQFVPASSNHFVSDTLTSPSNYYFALEHNDTLCPTITVEGFNNCNCISAPGSMNTNPIRLCEYDTIFATYNYDYTFDNNDGLTFILHDSSGYDIGNIYAENDQPIFSYNNQLEYGKTYYVSAVVGNALGSSVDFNDDCTLAAEGTPVIFYQQPILNSLNDVTICENSQINIPIDISGNGPFKLYYSTGTDSLFWDITNDSLMLSVSNSQSFELIYLTDGNSPTCATDLGEFRVFDVTVNPIPTLSYTFDDSICKGNKEKVVLDIGGNNPFSLTLSGPDYNQTYSGLQNTDKIEFVPQTSGVYQISNLQDNSNPTCINDSVYDLNIKVLPLPDFTVSMSDICFGDSVAITLHMEKYPPYDLHVNDDFSGNSKYYRFTTDDTTFYWPLSDSANISIYYFTDNNPLNCHYDGWGISTFVNVNPNPFISIDYTDTICSGNSVDIPITLTGNGPFDVVYKANDDTQFMTLNNTDSYITVSPDTTTVYSIVSITDASNTLCTSTGVDSAFITVNPSPIGKLTADNAVCEGNSLPIYIDIEGTSPFTYSLSWNNGQANRVSSGNDTLEIYPEASGYVYLKNISDNAVPACETILADSIFIRVNPLPIIDLTVPDSICDKDALPIQIETFGAPNFNLTFTNEGSEFSVNNIGGDTTIYFHPQNSTSYTLTHVTDGATPQCETFPNQSFEVFLKPLPEVDFIALEPEGCSPWTVDFNAIYNTDEAEQFYWRFSDGGFSQAVDPTHTFSSGQYNISLTITGKNGCPNTLVKPNYVFAYPNPKADFYANPNPVGSSDPTVTFYDDIFGGYGTLWKFDSLAVDSLNFPATYTFPIDEPGQYDVCLKAENQYGCSDTICKIIVVNAELTIYVPNAFSPNGDGVNDIFIPIINGSRENSYRFQIYDRWGERVFDSENISKGWDGTYKGKMCIDGIYTWRLYVKNEHTVETKEINGMVTLLK